MADTGRCSGTCFCGAVEIEVSGEPVAMGYCHCASCRHVRDGLPKMKDMPKEMGGSGETIPE